MPIIYCIAIFMDIVANLSKERDQGKKSEISIKNPARRAGFFIVPISRVIRGCSGTTGDIWGYANQSTTLPFF
jgi:hypothetical protein